MKRWALVKNGVVAAVVSRDDHPRIDGLWVECGNVGPGWTYKDEVFAKPILPRRLSKLQFQQLLGDTIYLAIKAKAQTDPVVDLWLDKFNLLDVEADGTSIDLSDPRTREGLQALVGAGVGLTAQRVEEILA